MSEPNQVEQGVDYMLVPVGSDENPEYAIRILQDRFHGLYYKYNWVKPPNPDGTWQFEYDVLENPGDWELDSEIEQLVGDILFDIILNGKDEHRNPDTSESST